jgi:hypothetical protein
MVTRIAFANARLITAGQFEWLGQLGKQKRTANGHEWKTTNEHE